MDNAKVVMLNTILLCLILVYPQPSGQWVQVDSDGEDEVVMICSLAA